ncbi:MAG: NADH-quinone oxidoreductase subunit J [Acidobacteria bacterium]|nr:MAG: NADH-quinone oxidoreductase subunit J [Acidobacteriota bacterium]PYR75628.1 MAG: NADH-quinone oxidoreductase subunit J [Acidobacteriota bacterium]
MLDAIAFYTLAALILAFAIAVITARNPVHSVVFLVINFLAVAIVYIVLGAEFLAMIQVLVYAGGIVVLYLFVVMLVNLKRGPEAHQDPRRQTGAGVGLAVAVLAELTAILAYTGRNPLPAVVPAASARGPGGNTEQLGWLLYTTYLIPFEVASMLLLVAMIGAIVLARKVD